MKRPRRLLIGDLILDTGTRQVSRGREVIELPRLSYQLILTLADAAPNVVTQDELIDRVWPGRIVSPETITQRIKLVRQALGDDASEPRYIGLVRSEGYRLLVEVEELPPEETSLSRGLFAELGRRRVPQVALLYAAIAWSVTEVLSFLLDALPIFPGWSKALVAIIFVVGFPVAMFLAWRFDIGRDGIKRTQAATTEGRLTIAAASLLLVGATAGLFYLIYPRVLEQAEITESQLRTSFRGVPSPNAIAVLPFTNASENPDDLYMSEGLGDELRDQLGRIGELQVAARSSSVIFRDQAVDALAIADRLGVSKLIEGTLRREGDQLRITVQIIDGDSGFQIWTESYDRTAVGLLDIQQEIALEVVQQVLPESDRPLDALEPATLDASAHELMMLARYLFQQVKDNPIVDLGKLNRAIDYYRQATVADPGSALAQARLATALLYRNDLELAEPIIERALAIDPDLSEVQHTLGLYYWLRQTSGAGDAYERAIELNPNNADALEAYAMWRLQQGNAEAPEEYYRRALALDPMSISRYRDLGAFLGMSGRSELVLELAEQIPARFNDSLAFLELARMYEYAGDLDFSIAWALRAKNLDPEYRQADWYLAELYARIGDAEAAQHFQPEPDFARLYFERRYDEFIDLAEDLVLEHPYETLAWYGLARGYVATGRYELAVRALRAQRLPETVYVDSRRSNGIEALVTLADALAASGETEQSRQMATWLVALYQSMIDTGADKAWWTNLNQACSLSILDEDERALDVLERIVDSPGLAWYPVLKDSHCFRKFTQEPRYLDVVAGIEGRMDALRERVPDTLARFQTFQ